MSKKDTPANMDEAAAGGNVEQIRDILFGGQMREYERRFKQLEERLINESENLRGESDKRIAALEAFAKKELNKQTEDLQHEGKLRDAAIKDLSKSLESVKLSLEERITTMQERATRDLSEIRDQLHAQAKESTEQIRLMQTNMAQSLEQESNTLQESKVGREDLADLLAEMSLRLKREFDMPED